MNIAAHPSVGFVVFETPVPAVGRTRAVYAEARAAEVPEAERAACLAIYDRRARALGDASWTAERIVAPAALRLYRAVASRLFVLDPDRDVRKDVSLGA
jgi:hypothetical protein